VIGLDLQNDGPMTQNMGSAAIRTFDDAERAHITAMLRETHWVIGGLRGPAAQLGLPRTTPPSLGVHIEAAGFDFDRQVPPAGEELIAPWSRLPQPLPQERTAVPEVTLQFDHTGIIIRL
jgi:hypothetical protein